MEPIQPIPVIIPVFNRPEWTKVCLDALVDEKAHGVPIFPIIVDNGSRPKTSRLIQEWILKAGFWEGASSLTGYVRRETNGGFATAVNAGLQEACSFKSVCIMHNDCVPFFPGWLAEMSSVLEGDDDIGLVIPKTNYANEHGPCIEELRKKYEVVKPSNKDRISPEDVVSLIERVCGADRKAFVAPLEGQAIRTSYSQEISCFCMLVRMELFQKYGKFDEDFWPRGWEDKWWWRPAERDGLVAMVANRAFVFHGGNITSDGPGFCFPDIMRLNEEKYRKKCEEYDRNMTGKHPSPSSTGSAPATPPVPATPSTSPL